MTEGLKQSLMKIVSSTIPSLTPLSKDELNQTREKYDSRGLSTMMYAGNEEGFNNIHKKIKRPRTIKRLSLTALALCVIGAGIFANNRIQNYKQDVAIAKRNDLWNRQNSGRLKESNPLKEMKSKTYQNNLEKYKNETIALTAVYFPEAVDAALKRYKTNQWHIIAKDLPKSLVFQIRLYSMGGYADQFMRLPVGDGDPEAFLPYSGDYFSSYRDSTAGEKYFADD